MLGRTHLALGALAGVVLERYFLPSNVNAYYILVLIGAILPDIDHQGSTINNIIPLTRFAAKVMHHRGIFHTIFMPILIMVIAGFLGYPAYGWYLVIGYIVHLLSDSLTELGVNWLHPFSEEKLCGPIRTGTWAEHFVFLLALFLVGMQVF